MNAYYEPSFIDERVETLGQQSTYRERYDLAVARAVSRLVVLAEYLLPLLTSKGIMLAQKGQYPTDELAESQYALQLLGGDIAETMFVNSPYLEASRHLIVVKKVTSTPAKYPRRPGIPTKKPLLAPQSTL